MPLKHARESFASYAAHGRGIPYLVLQRNKKTAHAEWGDGSLRDFELFQAAIDEESMNRELGRLWKTHEEMMSGRSRLFYGGLHGGVSYFPIPQAERAVEIVRRYYADALEMMIAAGVHTAGSTWDDFCTLHDRLRAIRGYSSVSVDDAGSVVIELPSASSFLRLNAASARKLGVELMRVVRRTSSVVRPRESHAPMT